MSQPQFLCVHRRPATPAQAAADDSARQKPPSPEDMKAMYEAFEAWRQRFADNLVDLGGRLLPESKLVTADGVEDGPLPEAKEVIGGYMIVQAADIKSAADIVAAMPGSGGGGHIEVRPIQRPPG